MRCQRKSNKTKGMTETREMRKDGGEEGKSKERCKNPSCKRIEKEKQRSERGSSDKAKDA
jgi:hypothetical protein